MNNRTVTVITPTTGTPERRDYLHDLRHSLDHQGVSWRWVIALDGRTAPLPSSIVNDQRVTVVTTGANRRGAAAARNLALTRVRTQWVTSVDDDDLLADDSLLLRVNAALSRLGLGWSCGRMVDLLPGGETTQRCSLLPTEDMAHQQRLVPSGPVDPGGPWRAWPESRAPFPLSPSALMVRTSLLRAVGGWPGTQQREDYGMAMAVTSVASGVMLDDIVCFYRQHPHQVTATLDYADREAVLRWSAHERGRLLAMAGAELIGLP